MRGEYNLVGRVAEGRRVWVTGAEEKCLGISEERLSETT